MGAQSPTKLLGSQSCTHSPSRIAWTSKRTETKPMYEDLNLHRWRSNWSCDVLSTQVLITTGLLEAFWGIAAGRGSSCEKMSFTSSKLAKFVHSSQVLTCFEASAKACESARIQGPTLKLHHLVQWQPQYMSMPCPSHFCTTTSDAAEGLIVQKSDTNECLHW